MKVLIFIIFILVALVTTLIHSQSNITYDAGTNMEIQTGADVCADAIIINGTYSGTGTICQGALPVGISSFTSSVERNNVKLFWTTEWELNNSGFDVERKEVSSNQWQKTSFVQGSGTTNEPRNYTFEDRKLKTGTYQYRLKQIDYNGNYEYFALESDVLVKAPGKFDISQNYPNPSNPKSKIDYELPIEGRITILLYNLLGQEVKEIVNEVKEAGYYTAEFDGSNLASGVYFYRILSGDFKMVKKLVLVK